jgi:hypothetical protein
MTAWSADEVHLTDDAVHVGIGATARERCHTDTTNLESSRVAEVLAAEAATETCDDRFANCGDGQMRRRDG